LPERRQNRLRNLGHNMDLRIRGSPHQHGHHEVLQFALPKFPVIELCLHRLARSEAGKGTHKKEGIGVSRRKETGPGFSSRFPCARERNISRNRGRRPGLVLWVRISTIIRGLRYDAWATRREGKNTRCGARTFAVAERRSTAPQSSGATTKSPVTRSPAVQISGVAVQSRITFSLWPGRRQSANRNRRGRHHRRIHRKPCGRREA